MLIQRKIEKVMTWVGGVEKQIRPSGWKPGANTVAYYPLTENVNDYSGNGRNGTATNVSYTTLSTGKKVGQFNGNGYISLGNASWTYNVNLNTISVWFRWNGAGAYSDDNCIIGKSESYMRSTVYGQYQISIHGEDRRLIAGWMNGSDYNNHPLSYRTSSGGSPTLGPVAQSNKWYNLILTRDGNTKKAYIDGVLVATESNSDNTSSYGNNMDLRIGSFVYYNHNSYFNGNISDAIFENKARTASDVSDYYNLTKSNYGL